MVNKTKPDKGVTLIGVDTTIEGHIRYSGELHVNGAIVGQVESETGNEGTLVVSENGVVKGDVRVPNVVIAGVVEGDVHADEQVEVGKQARVCGDMRYKLLKVHNGAVIEGKLIPQEETASNVHVLPVDSQEDDGSDLLNS